MTQEQAMGVARHILTGLGGALVVMGWLDTGTAAVLVGGGLSVVGFVWSFMAKTK